MVRGVKPAVNFRQPCCTMLVRQSAEDYNIAFIRREKTMLKNRPFNRIILIVLDSAGIGEMPDAAAYGDKGADTIGHTLASRTVRIPNLQQLGLANIRPLAVPSVL